MYVFDTNVFIYYLQNSPDVVQQIEQWLQQETILTSSIVEAELLSWPKLILPDHIIILNILSTVRIIPVGSTIAQLAARFRRTYSVDLLDAFIAATAIIHHSPLVTRNTKDFAKIKELVVVKI